MQGKFAMNVKKLTEEYGVYVRNLGLGVFMNIWKELWIGAGCRCVPKQQQDADRPVGRLQNPTDQGR